MAKEFQYKRKYGSWNGKYDDPFSREPKEQKPITPVEQDAVTADFQIRTDLTQAQKDSAYQAQKGLIDSTGKTIGYTPSVQQQEINQFVGGDEPKGFSPRGKAAEEFLSLLLQGGKNAAEAVIGGLQTVQKGREGIRKGVREVVGQDKVKDEFIISDKQGEITSTTDPKIAQSYREQGFKVASRFGDRSQISTGLKDVASGLGKQAAGALQAGLSSLPAVAALNVASPALTKLGGDIAETAGYKREKGEEITQKIAPFVFGLPVGIGSLASEEITKILDNAGAFDVFSLEDKNTAKDLIQNGLFFGIAGLGGKGVRAGKEKVKKIIEGKTEIPEFMPKALGEQGLFEKEAPKPKIIPEAEKQTADLPTLEEQRAIQERQTEKEIPRGEKYFTEEDAPENVKENFRQSSRDFPTTLKAIENVPKQFYKILEDKTKVYLVDGNYIRNNVDIDFTMGGHEYVYPKYIPKNEVWLDRDMAKGDLENTLRHETTERIEMKSRGKKYDDAHAIANKEEIAIRRGKQGKGLIGVRPEAEIPSGEKGIDANKNAAFALFEKGKKPSEVVKGLNITRQEAVSYKKEFDEAKTAKDKYFWYDWKEKKFKEAQQPKKINLDFEGEFFADKRGKSYAITEAKTGMNVGGGKTIKEAIANANAGIKKNLEMQETTLDKVVQKRIDEQGISPRYKLEETVKPEVPKVVEPPTIEPPVKFTVQKKAELPKVEQKPIETQKPIAEDITKIPETITEPVKAEVPKPKISFAPPKDANAVIVNFIDGKQSKLPVKDLDVLGSDPSKFKNISFGKVDLNKTGGLKWDTFKEIKKIDTEDPAFAGVKEQIPASLEAKQKPVKASEIIAQVERGLGVPIRTGKVTKSTARAFYKVKPEVIRMREANDLDSMSHEIAHHIDKKILGGFREGENKKRFEEWRNELQSLDYDQAKKRTYEGFAEFMRHYLTRDDAATKAPEFYKHFENEFLPQNPEILKVIKMAKESITAWREQGSLSRVISQIDFAGRKSVIPFKERFEGAKIKTQQLVTDRLAPLKYVVGQILKESGKELRPSEDPYQIAASVAKTAAAKARQFVMDGSFDFQLNKKGKGLKEIVTPVAQEIEPAIAYAYAKHAKSLHERGINPGIELRDAEYVLANYKKQEYENFSKEFTEYSNYLIDYLVDAGGLSKEAAGRMRELNPFYIPLKRSFVDKVISTPKGKGVVDLPSPIKKIKGSGREIINPLESIIAQTEQIIAVADKARVARALANLSDKFEGIGKWIEKVPAPIETKITELENLKKQIEDAGGDLSNADTASIITLFSQGKNYFGKDNIVSIYRKGKREFFELDPILYDAMKGLDKVTLPIMLDYVLGKPTRAIRLGATGIRAGFSLITNPIRDVQAFMLQSEKAGARPDKVAKAIFEELQGKSEFAKEFRRSGGEMAQPLGLDRKTLQNAVQEILANDKKSKALNVVKHPIEATRKILSFPEAGTRLAEFEAVMNKYKPKFEEAKAKGDLSELKKLQEDASIEASNAANEVTVNFKRAGAYTEILNQIIPFFNPAVQGVSRMGRTVYAHPVRSGLRATALLTAPTLALWWINKDEDWYKNLPDWQKYGFWNFKVGDEIIRLPKPFEWGYLFGAVPEGVANSLYQENPQYYKNAIGTTIDAMMPDITPGAIKPAMETYFNWDVFKERPIVSKSQEGLLPEQQFSPYTSGLSKEVGKLLNFSPAKLDHLLSGYTGGLATDILNGLPKEYKEMADVPIIGRLFTRTSATGFGGENVQRFYDILKETESVVRTKKIKEEGGDIFETTDLQKKQIEKIKEIRKTAKDLKWLRERQRDINKLDTDVDIKSKLNKEIEYAAAKRAEIMLEKLEGKNEEDSINLPELKAKLQQYAPEREKSKKERKFRINYK